MLSSKTLTTLTLYIFPLLLLSSTTTSSQNLALSQADLVLLPCTLSIATSQQYPCEQQGAQLGGGGGVLPLGDQMSSNQQNVPSISSQFEQSQQITQQQIPSNTASTLQQQQTIANTPQILQPLSSNFRLTKLADLVQIIPEVQQPTPLSTIPPLIESEEAEAIEFIPTPTPLSNTQIPLTLPMMPIPLCSIARLCPVVGGGINTPLTKLPSASNLLPLRSSNSPLENPSEFQNYLPGYSQTLLPRSTSSLNKNNMISSSPLNKNNNLFYSPPQTSSNIKTTNFNFANSPQQPSLPSYYYASSFNKNNNIQTLPNGNNIKARIKNNDYLY